MNNMKKSTKRKPRKMKTQATFVTLVTLDDVFANLTDPEFLET